MPQISASSALARLRVLDLSRVRAGPTCVRQFADFGADVIKIESPPGVDPNEGMGGPRDGPDMQNLHRNKRSITLNLKLPEAREVFARLAKTADVVVENYRPDVKFRLGIDYESLAKINPRIILASISGFGQDGPYRDRPGFDQIAQGMSGIMGVTGEHGGKPMRVGAAVADVAAGLYAALGILTALLEREHSGKGQWVQSSLLHAGVGLLDFQAARYLMKGEVPPAMGNDHPTSMPTSAYQTADGYINVACSGEGMWKRLCNLLGREDLLAMSEFKDNEARSRNRRKLNEILNQAFAAQDSKSWIDELNKAGVPCGPIYKMNEVFADPQVQHIGIAAEANHPRLGRYRIVAQPSRLSRTPATVASATPELGQHTGEVLGELGYKPDEIAALKGKGAI
ncbi:MAG TPA: CaiB/BaiF CoA-transferase family protein [Burkholderiales bacterium]|nr:CaiB/BaiF CoA-transferase family protein [Burkholderiales bacterium]HXJ08847.1 CaiB/BaiF CoA-transferase family protein [Burkholderiales bacterium]